MAVNKKKACGICSTTCGVILIILGFVFWVIFSAALIAGVKSENFIYSPVSTSLPPLPISSQLPPHESERSKSNFSLFFFFFVFFFF